MSRILKRAAVLTAAAAATLVMTPMAALADYCSGSGSCVLSPTAVPGGTQLFIDFDVHGSGGAEYVVFRNSNVLCRWNFDAAAGPATRGCGNGTQAAGTLSGTIVGPQGPSYLNVRW